MSICFVINEVYLFQAYYKVNQLFAEKTIMAVENLKNEKEAEDLGPPLIWLHDYHLMIAANFIRSVSISRKTSLKKDYSWNQNQVGTRKRCNFVAEFLANNSEDFITFHACCDPNHQINCLVFVLKYLVYC